MLGGVGATVSETSPTAGAPSQHYGIQSEQEMQLQSLKTMIVALS